MLVAKHTLDLGPTAVKDGGKRGNIEVVGQRFRSECRDAWHVSDVPDKVNGESLLRPLLSQVKPRSVVKGEPEGQGALAGLDRLVRHLFPPAQPARAREVEHQVEIAVGTGSGEVEKLAVPPHLGDRPPGQRGQRRVEGLEHGERRRVGTGNGMTASPLTQEPGERFDLRQLRHTYECS